MSPNTQQQRVPDTEDFKLTMVDLDQDGDAIMNQQVGAERQIMDHVSDVGQQIMETLQGSTSDMLAELKVSISTRCHSESAD